MEAKIKTIAFNIKYLNESTNNTDEVKKAIVHDIHNDLSDMVNTFDHPHSGFRKHPLLTIPLLFSLASFDTVYGHIEVDLNSELPNRSIIGCKLQEILKEYQPLATIDRLTKIKVVSALIPSHTYGCSKYLYLR